MSTPETTGEHGEPGRHTRCEAVTDIGAITRNGGDQCIKVVGHEGMHCNSIGLAWSGV